MNYTVIYKLEYFNSIVTSTPVGYTTDSTLVDTINSDYDSTLGAWVETNKNDLESSTTSISTFFDSTPTVHIARTGVNYTTDLPEITDINEL